jgi:signal transduction histidine kinase
MLGIALSNLVDNALKYSFTNTFVHIKSEYHTKMARIIINDVGGQMPEEARANLYQPGRRWAVSAGARRIPGMGLGLWEANIIARVHGGEVNFSTTEFPKRGKDAFLVSVWLELLFKRP